MVALARRYGSGSSLLRDISRQEEISEKYLGQIVIPLKSAGLVISHRGSRGGYALARPPGEITVRDVVEALEGAIAPVECVDPATGAGGRDCGENAPVCERVTQCVATRVWMRLRDDIVRSLSSFTLGDRSRLACEIGEPAANYVI